jgi:hypothetical protein
MRSIFGNPTDANLPGGRIWVTIRHNNTKKSQRFFSSRLDLYPRCIHYLVITRTKQKNTPRSIVVCSCKQLHQVRKGGMLIQKLRTASIIHPSFICTHHESTSHYFRKGSVSMQPSIERLDPVSVGAAWIDYLRGPITRSHPE